MFEIWVTIPCSKGQVSQGEYIISPTVKIPTKKVLRGIDDELNSKEKAKITESKINKIKIEGRALKGGHSNKRNNKTSLRIGTVNTRILLKHAKLNWIRGSVLKTQSEYNRTIKDTKIRRKLLKLKSGNLLFSWGNNEGQKVSGFLN